jgi:hypothetical protein
MSSGIYFARFRVKGKLIRRSLFLSCVPSAVDLGRIAISQSLTAPPPTNGARLYGSDTSPMK